MGAESERGSRSAPAADDESPRSGVGDEFLFHLYRGTALLEDDQVEEAKSELERALSLQPRDVEGQSLLGVVYFRLGHYPRAIQIYEELSRARPSEIAPKTNLALCYLKTGQLPMAKGLLEEIVQAKPSHARAWGYLGLVYQRLGDFEKASISFERAGKPRLAARLRDAQVEASREPDVTEIAHHEAHRALGASEMPPSMPPPSVPPPSLRPILAPGTRVAVPPRLGRIAREAQLIFPEDPAVVVHEDGVVLARINGSFNVRADALYSALADNRPFEMEVLRRRVQSSTLNEPMGRAAAPLMRVEGVGRVIVGPPLSGPSPKVRLITFRLGGEPVYLREERLVAFESTAHYENGRIALGGGAHVPIVQLIGEGTVVVSGGEHVDAVDVSDDQSAHFSSEVIIGWIGHLLPRASPAVMHASLSGMVAFSGSGTLILDLS